MPDRKYFENLIWQVADLLCGPYRPLQYEREMLPMTVLRRFDCVLAPTKKRVLAEYEKRKGGKLQGDALDARLNEVAGQRFHNHSELDSVRLRGDPTQCGEAPCQLHQGLFGQRTPYLRLLEVENEIERMREANLLYRVVSKLGDVDLHPKTVPNRQMGLIFDALI